MALALVLAPLPLLAEDTQPGEVAENLQILPPWTMRLCTVGAKLHVLQAVYDKEGALTLKKRDSDCYTWRETAANLERQVALHKDIAAKYTVVLASMTTQLRNEAARTAQLVDDLKKEIAEKNKYKYKPTYGWLGWVVGGGVALVALGVLTGVLIADRS